MPSPVTSATLGLELDQVALVYALSNVKYFTQIKISLPGNITIDLSVNTKPFTLTLTTHIASKFPSSDIVVISHVPSSTAVTTPFSFTVAIDVSELSHFKFLFVVFEGVNSKVSFSMSVTSNVIELYLA